MILNDDWTKNNCQYVLKIETEEYYLKVIHMLNKLIVKNKDKQCQRFCVWLG